MRLKELTRPNTMNDVVRVLSRQGYELVTTQGSYSRILARPSDNYILKLFSNLDIAYPKFVRLTYEHPNIHWPKWRSKIIRVNENYSAIRIERLQPIPETQENFSLVYELLRYCSYLRNPNNIRFDRVTDEEKDKILKEIEPSLAQALQILVQFLKKDYSASSLDLKLNNIMLRGSTWVIIDPFY